MATTSPLTLVVDIPHGVWECTTCTERYHSTVVIPPDEPRPWRDEHGNLTCRDCIKSLFENALKFDIDFPARWGGTELNVWHFVKLWPVGDFPIVYQTKRAELRLEQSRAQERLKDKDVVPEGFVLGREFQRCPKCTAPFGLHDGCNHMICPKCETNFCFICGEEAKDGSDHWSRDRGVCPRYGAVDANPIYDNLGPTENAFSD